MPKRLSDKDGDVSIPVTITMDSGAWMTYPRAAKVRGLMIEDVLSELLQSEDCEYENRQYKTSIQAEEERHEKSEKASNSQSRQAAEDKQDPADWWKKEGPESGS